MSREPKKVLGQEPATSVKSDEVAESKVNSVLEIEDVVSGNNAPSAVIKRKDKFFRGVWANKSNPADPDKVVITINGEPIMWQRGVECIVPECYLLAAKDAKYNKYTQEPNKGRKVAARIDRFPFTVTGNPEGEYIFDEFKRKFAEGTKKTKEAVGQYGLAIPVERAVQQFD